MRKLSSVLLSLLVLSVSAIAVQTPGANQDPTYRQLRDIGVGSESVSVTNFVLKRDAGTFTFKQGTFAFLTPVNGKVTGAVFVGDGEFNLKPPIASEQRSLALLTKHNDPSMTETFNTVVLRFTDNSYDEIKKAGTAGGSAGTAGDALHDARDNARNKLKTNYDARILQDVLSNEPGGFFLAFIRGKNYSGRMLYCIDPHGSEYVAPEEISLRTYDDMKSGIWAAFHYSDEYPKGVATGTQENTAFDVDNQKLDTKIEKNAYLRGDALTTVISQVADLRAVNLQLFPTLRVEKVTDASGAILQYVQEDKDHDADFWVILPKSLAKGEKFEIHTVYEGKDAVQNTGGGNYYPVARDDWYPNARFGRYSNYELKFHTPKRIQLIATGALVSETTEGDDSVTVWKSEVPLAVAGFNLGDFKKMEAKVDKTDYVVQSYANKELPDDAAALKRYAGGDELSHDRAFTGVALGSMDTTIYMKKPLAEAQLSMALYTDYFGAIPYKHVSMTQQTACTYGQSWPNLVYLPICSFFDATVRHQIGLDDIRGYWTTVAPHEVAHQWWGHAVGFNSYRDQWMSEGFSEFSASLFVQMIEGNGGRFQKIWKDQLDLMTEKNAQGFRAIDVGSLTLGYRLQNSRTGYVTRRLIYPKGAYVLHMIRMMMWDRKNGDQHFRDMMHDFVKTYSAKAASTEDFKAMVEKHMTPGMDLTKDHKMDWFFDEYVYGTALPDYQFQSGVADGPNGAYNIYVKITQSNVDDNFRMLVPFYIELGDGRITRLGQATLVGNKTFEQTFPLSGLPQKPKRLLLNYYYDVLATGY